MWTSSFSIWRAWITINSFSRQIYIMLLKVDASSTVTCSDPMTGTSVYGYCLSIICKKNKFWKDVLYEMSLDWTDLLYELINFQVDKFEFELTPFHDVLHKTIKNQYAFHSNLQSSDDGDKCVWPLLINHYVRRTNFGKTPLIRWVSIERISFCKLWIWMWT